MDIVAELKDGYSFLGDPMHRKAYEEIERLRSQMVLFDPNTTQEMAAAALNFANDEIKRLQERNHVLREALRDIYEVYAGSEGIPKPMTAAEGYLLELLMEAVRIAARALAGKIEEVSDGHC